MIKLAKREVENRDGRSMRVPWTHANPFVTNERGKLVHRLRSGSDHHNTWVRGREGKMSYSHSSVQFYCGNGTTGRLVDQGGNIDLVEKVPDGMCICVHCEYMAERAGQPSADELNGKHVHTGRLVVKQLCCVEESE